MPCTVKASQEFDISCGQISLEFKPNSDNTFVPARSSWKSLCAGVQFFLICLPHVGLQKGVSSITGALSFSITNLNLLEVCDQRWLSSALLAAVRSSVCGEMGTRSTPLRRLVPHL